MIDRGYLKATDIRGPLRAGRVWGWYFLPADPTLGLTEMVVDMRRLHTIPLGLLRDLCLAGQRLGRVQPLYREHLGRHFAETFARIGPPPTRRPPAVRLGRSRPTAPGSAPASRRPAGRRVLRGGGTLGVALLAIQVSEYIGIVLCRRRLAMPALPTSDLAFTDLSGVP